MVDKPSGLRNILKNRTRLRIYCLTQSFPNWSLDLDAAVLKEKCVIGAVDVGSPRNIGWAVLDGVRSEHGTNLDDFVECFSNRSKGRPSALGFEAPLFVPHNRPLSKLTGQRNGENGRPWSAGAGATVTTIGLVVVNHVLREMLALDPERQFILDWERWPESDKTLVFEAFVSGDNHAGPGEHWKDAFNAANGFAKAIGNLNEQNAVVEGDVFSLVGACLLRTCWSNDLSLLQQSCLVIRP